MSVSFHVLGTMRVSGPDGEVEPSSCRVRGLLAALLLEGPATVTTSRLAAAVWDRPPRSAAVNLRTLVSQLRTCLDAVEPGLSGRVTTLRGAGGGSGGYGLRCEPQECDGFVFRQLYQKGRQALAAGQDEVAIAVLESALSMWRGPAGIDVPHTHLLTSRFHALTEMRLNALEDYHHALLRRGDLVTVIPEVRETLMDHPLRERSWSHMMRGLYLSGDVGAALASYDQVRELLNQDLGLDPSASLSELQLAILQGRTDEVRQHCWQP